MTTQTSAAAAQRVRELEAALEQARADLTHAVVADAERGIKLVRIAADTGLSRFTISKYLRQARAEDSEQTSAE